MSNDLTLIQKLIAVELGVEFEVFDKRYLDDPAEWRVPYMQTLQEACLCVSGGLQIRLTSKPWDSPVETRKDVIGWMRFVYEDDDFGRWNKTAVYSGETVAPDVQFVTPDPRNPDQPPPEDWTPENRRTVK